MQISILILPSGRLIQVGDISRSLLKNKLAILGEMLNMNDIQITNTLRPLLLNKKIKPTYFLKSLEEKITHKKPERFRPR